MKNLQENFEKVYLSTRGALCAREFSADVEGEIVAILAVVYSPVIDATGPVCRYTIKGAGLNIDTTMGGFDRMAAIVNTFYALRLAIEELPYEVTWLGYPGMLDLPKSLSHGLGAHFERHCEDLIDAEHSAASSNISEVRRLWPLTSERYEDCEGYLAGARLS